MIKNDTQDNHVVIKDIALEYQRRGQWQSRMLQLCKKANLSYEHGQGSISAKNYQHNRVLWVHWGDLVPDIETLESINKNFAQHGKTITIVSDSFFGDAVCLSNLCCISEPKLISLGTSKDKVIRSQVKNKLYNCFIHRVDDIRQSWFYHLYNRGLLDKGYVSFLLYQIYDIDTDRLFKNNHEKSLNTLPAFNQAFEDLINQVPYQNFENSENLAPFIADSKYSVILDTYALEDDHFAKYYSEKVVRSLENPCVDLLFGQKNALNELKKHGFEICDQVLQYDSLDWIQRQLAILDILETDSIDVDNDTLYQQALHNKSVMSEWYNTIWTDKYFNSIVDKVINYNGSLTNEHETR